MAFTQGVTVVLQCVCLAVSHASPAVPGQCADRGQVPDHLRPQSCALVSALVSGLSRSSELRHLAERIEELNGMVFIEPGTLVQSAENRVLMGALLHRTSIVGGRRAAFIVVRPDRGDDTVITLAHEFQHVIEVLQSGASTESEIDALFARIGAEVGANIMETNEAVLAGRRVAQELARSRR